MTNIFYIFDENELSRFMSEGFGGVVLTHDFLVIDRLKEGDCPYLSIWDILDSSDVNRTRLRSLSLAKRIKFKEVSNYEMQYAIETYLNAKIIVNKITNTTSINLYSSFISKNIRINRFDSDKLHYSLSLILKNSLNKFMGRKSIAIHEIK